MNTDQITRLRTVFRDLQRSVEDTLVEHSVTPEELTAFTDWVKKVVEAGQFDLAVFSLMGIPTMSATAGAAYAHPELDGATTFVVEGPAYVEGAPHISNPGQLPMRPDEGGEPLFVSGVVKSTHGEPLPGAVIDIWQNDTDGYYGGMTLEAAELTPGVVDLDAPKYNLRGKITTDAQGRYAYRTVLPGPERLSADDTAFTEMLELLDIVNSRPLHIHAIIAADGFSPLTHQIYFDTDPMAEHSSEGPLDPSTIYTTQRRRGSVPFGPDISSDSYLTVSCDYVLRPVEAA